MITNIFALLLIGLGSFLEIYYYIVRFQNDGIDFWLCLCIGVALTIALNLLVYGRDKKYFKIGIAIMIVYSVLATSAGQNFSFQNLNNETVSEEIQSLYISDDIEDVKNQIANIDERIYKIQSDIDQTVNSLSDRAYWGRSLPVAEKAIKDLKIERQNLRDYLREITPMAKSYNKIKTTKQNLYQFYNELIPIPVKLLQFLFQTILSMFIAAMAPMGIIMFVLKPKTRRRKKKIIISNDMIKKWINISWTGIRTGKTNKILSKDVFLKFCLEKNDTFGASLYSKLFKLAIKSGVIDKSGVVIESDTERASRRMVDNNS